MEQHRFLTAWLHILFLLISVISICLLVQKRRSYYRRLSYAIRLKNRYSESVALCKARAVDSASVDFLLINRDDAYLKDSMAEYMHNRPPIVQFKNSAVLHSAAPKRMKKEKAAVVFSSISKLIKTPTPFSWPLKQGSFWLSSFFGPRKRADGSHGFHTGLDLAALKGTPIYAPRSGIVLQACYSSGYGKMIIMHHGKRFKTRYAHLSNINVMPGQRVGKGEIIGCVGDTGCIRKKGKDGSHLHFEVYEYGRRVNPMQFLPELVF